MKKLIIPRNLGHNELVALMANTEYAEYTGKKKFIESCVLFLHIICVGRSTKRAHDTGYIRLSSETLKKTFCKNPNRPTYYQRIINALCDVGIIEVNNSYSTELKQCKGYRLTAAYGGPTQVTEVAIKYEEPRVVQDDRAYEMLKRLKVDGHKLQAVKSRLYYGETLSEDISLLRLQLEDIYIIKDKNGRLQHNVANMSKIYRGCLTANGEELSCVDISNAFQFFLIKPLLEDFSKEYGIFKDHEGVLPDDVVAYIDCVVNGRFVQVMAEAMNVTFDIEDYYRGVRQNLSKRKTKKYVEKKLFKENLFAKVFFNPLRKTLNPYSSAFVRLFPNVWHFISEGKIIDYKYLSNDLQRIESEVMTCVLDKLFAEHPSGYFLRLHDCVITTQDSVEAVKREIKAQCVAVVGYAPKVSQSKLSEQTDEVLCRDPQSPLFKVLNMDAYNKVMRRTLRAYYRTYSNTSMVSSKMREFERLHYPRYKASQFGQNHSQPL